MAQQKGMKRAEKVLKRKQVKRKLAKANNIRLAALGVHPGQKHDHAHDHDHDHDHEHGAEEHKEEKPAKKKEKAAAKKDAE